MSWFPGYAPQVRVPPPALAGFILWFYFRQLFTRLLLPLDYELFGSRSCVFPLHSISVGHRLGNIKTLDDAGWIKLGSLSSIVYICWAIQNKEITFISWKAQPAMGLGRACLSESLGRHC